jgi:transcriptional regulator with XRE-family HTH domain
VEQKATVSFARNLRRLRKKRGLTQYDLADLTGISRRMIGHYETHAVEPPIDKLESIAAALKVRVSALFENGKEAIESEVDPLQFDTRSLKKLRDILTLPLNDRSDLYRMLNKMLRKNQLERERAVKVADSKAAADLTA